MDRVFYNKLIRDGIKDKMEKVGASYEIREIDDDQEFQQELLKKVQEEASALSVTSSREEFLKEYADLMVVLDHLASELEISESEIKLALEENIKKKGGYKKKLFLHWSEDTGYKSNETPQGIK